MKTKPNGRHINALPETVWVRLGEFGMLWAFDHQPTMPFDTRRYVLISDNGKSERIAKGDAEQMEDRAMQEEHEKREDHLLPENHATMRAVEWFRADRRRPPTNTMLLLHTPTSHRGEVDYGYCDSLTREYMVITRLGYDKVTNYGSAVEHWALLPAPPGQRAERSDGQG